MTYFIYKVGAGIKPQSGYEQIGMFRGADTWILCKTENDLATIQALAVEKLIIGTDPDASILAVYPDLVFQKAAMIRAEGSKKLSELNGLAGGYLKEERETWYVQRDEALAYLADSNAATPMLSAIVANRPDVASVADLAGLIQSNIDMLNAGSGAILGKQQASLVSIYTAGDLAGAMGVEFPV